MSGVIKRPDLRILPRSGTIIIMTDNQPEIPETLDDPISPAEPHAEAAPFAAHSDEGEAVSAAEAAEEEPTSPLDAPADTSEAESDALESFTPAEPDVDAALSALSSLTVLAVDAPREAFDPQAVILSEELPQPPLATLERGTTPSVVPALLMIAVGVFLTFYLASGNPMPASQHLIGGGLILFGISSVTWWLGTNRWARGSLLVGLACIAGGAALFLV
ncbi:hypothetical protein VZO05_02065 [Aggregatilineales bacterium SYSU G02658]